MSSNTIKLYTNTCTSEQSSWEIQHQAHADADEEIADCCYLLRLYTWIVSFTPRKEAPREASEERPDPKDRLSLQCAGIEKPSTPTNKLNQNASAQKSSLNFRPYTRNDSSMSQDVPSTKLEFSELSRDTAVYWDSLAKNVNNSQRSSVEGRPLSIQEPASQALGDPRTMTTDGSTTNHLQLTSCKERLFPDLKSGLEDIRCDLGQTRSPQVCLPCTLDAKLTDQGRLYFSNHHRRSCR